MRNEIAKDKGSSYDLIQDQGLREIVGEIAADIEINKEYDDASTKFNNPNIDPSHCVINDIERSNIINVANNLIDEKFLKFGIRPFRWPIRNVALMPPDDFMKKYTTNNSLPGAIFDNDNQIIAIADYKILPNFARNVIHEMLHAKMYISDILRIDEIDKHRVGFETRATEREISHKKVKSLAGFFGKTEKKVIIKKRDYFVNLNEAIVEDITNEIYNKLLNECKEVKKQSDIIEKSDQEGELRGYELGVWDYEGDGINHALTVTSNFYNELVDTYYLLVNKISKYSDQSIDEIKNLFERGAVTGNYLPIAKVICKEKSDDGVIKYNATLFRELGHATGLSKGIGDFKKFVDSLDNTLGLDKE